MPVATPSSVVITPTIGRGHLRQCIASVQGLRGSNLEHLLVVDGSMYEFEVRKILASEPHNSHPTEIVVLNHGTGCGSFNGYRICAAFSLLVNADIVFFLDDDNWFDFDHLESCLNVLDRFNVDWAFALRRLCRENGSFLIDDNSNSLGFWRRDVSYKGPSDRLEQRFIDFYSSYPFLVDTNCYALRRELLVELAPLLLDGDCIFSTHLVRNVAGACTGTRSVNYRVRANSEMSTYSYVETGNSGMDARYCGNLPWMCAQRLEPLSLLRTDLTLKAREESFSNVAQARLLRRGSPSIAAHPDRRPPINTMAPG